VKPANAGEISLGMLLTAGAALFISVGCTTTSKMAKPLSDFSTATSDTTTVTTSALLMAQAADQERTIVVAAKKTDLTTLQEPDVPQFFAPNDLLQRQLALQALSTYAATLKTLSGVDRSADIQKSFDSLKTSMESTAGSITKLSQTSQAPIPNGVVSGLVSLGSNVAVGHMVGKREQAIRTALETNDKTVTKICRLLASELKPNGEIYDQLERAYVTQEEFASETFTAAVTPKPSDEAKDEAKSTPPPKPSNGAPSGDAKEKAKPPAPLKPSDRVPLIKTYVGLINKKEYALALLNSLASAYRKLAQAHTALMVQSESGTKSDLQLKSLTAEIESVKFFYSQIPK
jgi:hypothetical protein